ncbi:ABC transporter permease [Methylotenera sp. G11]|uniref:ABC transporter permease n=1 Tax=Methylotenera sp. G11 TaxID=1506585 RepID=UPI000A8C6F5E|nr:FtsX-like permease family protein [Methylotenera sp. G11]
MQAIMRNFILAGAQCLSLWRAGALRVLVFALALAVSAITAVGFFTERVESALSQQGALLLGGDLAVSADHEIPAVFSVQAQKQGFAAVNTYEFPSMVVVGGSSQLVEVKAVGKHFPLRGDLTLGAASSAAGQVVKAAPASGEAWIEPRLANALDLTVGDRIAVGEKNLLVAAILLREPSRGGDMFSFAPRLMMNAEDLAATKLIQYGSRVKYQLLLSGDLKKIQRYQQQMQPELGRGERMEDLRNARPEIKLALDKAEQFLGLSAMVSVILAMAAMLLSSMPYIRQSLDMFALMRCFGALQNTVLQVLAIQTLLIAFFSALLGIVIGYAAQLGLARLAGSLFVEALPPASFSPALTGLAASLAMMVAVVVPHAWQMRKLTAMNILRRETLSQPMSAQAKFLPAALVMAAMVFWQAQDAKIALSTILAMLALCAVVFVFSYGLVHLARALFRLSPHSKTLSAVMIGVQGLKTRLALSTVQTIGFSMGLMVLMLLALIRGDLINNWQASLPADAPNRFVINVQPQQIDGVKQFFSAQKIKEASVFPMVRARLQKINHEVIRSSQWKEERARRLAEREFNLSWADVMQSDNKLVAGRWWSADEYGKPYLSLEQDLAKTLGIQLGDQLSFDVAGTPLVLTVTSLRKVDWDTMRANFFAVTPPGVLDNFSANYISSFHLPLGADMPLNQLVKQYPNLTVIDIAALMQQVRGIMQKMSSTVEYVFIFSLVTGVAVLYAALVATRAERISEATLMRVFGASRRQVSVAYFTEFALIGLIAALVATVAANLLAYYISVKVLDIPFQFNLGLAVSAMLVSIMAIPFAAWLGLRAYLNIPPRQLLNSI